MTELKPCPFCEQNLELVESWAKSFDPPRLYREYHHRAPVDCVLGKRDWIFPDTAEDARQKFVAAWNTRALDPQVASLGAALEKAGKRLCDLTGPQSEDEETRIVVMEIRAALATTQKG